MLSADGTGLGDLPGIRFPKPVWLNNWGGRTNVGCGTARCAQVTLVKQLEQLFLCGAANIWKRQLWAPKPIYRSHAHVRTEKEPQHSPGITQLTFVFTLINHVHGCGQVPHLDAAIWMPGEQVAAWPGAHSAGSFTFSHSKWRDGSAVNCLDLTDPTAGETPSYQNNCTWQSLASKVSTVLVLSRHQTCYQKKTFLPDKIPPLAQRHAAQLQTAPSPQSTCSLTTCFFLLGDSHMFDVHFHFAMIRNPRLSQEWHQLAPSYARHSRKLTCRNSTLNHIKCTPKNPRMINPRLSTQITFVL